MHRWQITGDQVMTSDFLEEKAVVRIFWWIGRRRQRPRRSSLTISAVARVRDELAYASHTFFCNSGFRYVHTPIITTSDCEGAREMFQVTTLFSDAEEVENDLKQNPPPSETDIELAKLLIKEKGAVVAQLKSEKARN